MAIQLSDVPCDCMFPPFQCNVTNESLLPEVSVNGMVYVITNQPGREPYPMFYWNGEWIPLDDYIVDATLLESGVLQLTRKEGGVVEVDLSSLETTDTYVESIELDGTVLKLVRNDEVELDVDLVGLEDLYVTSVQLVGDDLQVTRSDGQVFTVDLSGYDSTDTNNYVTGVSLVGTTLTLTRAGLPNLTQDLSSINTDTNNYVSGMSLGGTTLTLNRVGLGNLAQDLASLNTNNYVTGATWTFNSLTSALTLNRLGLGNIGITMTQPNMGSRIVFPTTINSGVTTTLAFDSGLQYGSNTEWWNAGQPARLTPILGRYIVTAWITFTYTVDTPAYTSDVRLEVERIGTPDGIFAHTSVAAGNNIHNRAFATGHGFIGVVGDYLQVKVTNLGAGTMTITNGFIELSRLL